MDVGAFRAKVDGLLSQFFLEFFAISLNPLDKVPYFSNLTGLFAEMNYPEAFSNSDFEIQRDAKKVSRILSWLFQFVETLQPAQNIFFEHLKSIKASYSEAATLRSKIAALKISNKSDDEKRIEYQDRIVELRDAMSELYSKKTKMDEEEAVESKKLHHLLEMEKTNSQEVDDMVSRLEELKCKEENLRVKVISNPNLPQTMQELQEKANALELEMQESRSKIYQIDRDISQYKQLHEVIERQLISVCKECHSYLQQISQSKFDFTKCDGDIIDHAAEREELTKKLADLTDTLRLSEHKLVKERVVDATQTANDEHVKKEKNNILDKYCNVCESLNSDLSTMMSLSATRKAQCETEYNNGERVEAEGRVEEMSNILHRLYQQYVESMDWTFSLDDQ
ncbi:unnamed protein product [Rodentolepis nana]|uniref:DHR10 domain-containing protein n=1 Tax=Rodentolepis nana TaxID=102285 RepID=A0A0R3TWS7_RODNA|nr:unnamed protein product [Rodentolepis nana]